MCRSFSRSILNSRVCESSWGRGVCCWMQSWRAQDLTMRSYVPSPLVALGNCSPCLFGGCRPTRNRTYVPLNSKADSEPLDHQGSPLEPNIQSNNFLILFYTCVSVTTQLKPELGIRLKQCLNSGISGFLLKTVSLQEAPSPAT